VTANLPHASRLAFSNDRLEWRDFNDETQNAVVSSVDHSIDYARVGWKRRSLAHFAVTLTVEGRTSRPMCIFDVETRRYHAGDHTSLGTQAAVMIEASLIELGLT
jgi:hypothetical protein